MDSCPLIPGRVYATRDGVRHQFREHAFSRYDGHYFLHFFDPESKAHRTLQIDSFDELASYRLIAPELPAAAGWRLRWRLRRLLSPRAAERARAVHEIAALGEGALPALPWLRETAHFDDIEVEDESGRRTNPRAQARHALAALAELPSVKAAIERLPPLLDPGALPRPSQGPRPRLP